MVFVIYVRLSVNPIVKHVLVIITIITTHDFLRLLLNILLLFLLLALMLCYFLPLLTLLPLSLLFLICSFSRSDPVLQMLILVSQLIQKAFI